MREAARRILFLVAGTLIGVGIFVWVKESLSASLIAAGVGLAILVSVER